MTNAEKKDGMMVIGHSYNWFQKDTIDALSPEFNKIDVFIRCNPFAEVASIVPIHSLDRYRRAVKIENKAPENVHVVGTPIWYLPLERSYKKLGERHYRAVKNAINGRQQSYDIIHSHFLWTSGYVGARLKEELNIPLIVTAHGDDIYALPFRNDEWRNKIENVLNSADHIITVSQSNNQCIKKLDVSTSVSVIPNGFNEGVFFPRDEIICRSMLNLPLDKRIILVVASLEHVKGLEHLIEAMDTIAQRRMDCLCVIVGSGSKHSSLTKLIKKKGLENIVRLIGAKPHEDIAIWMAASDIVALSSLAEGNPTVMFEALGCGKPFVGTRVGGVPEIIRSDKFGLLVEPANSKDLAEKILLALDKEWDTREIRDYASQFTWRKVAGQIVELCRGIM